MAYSRSAFHRRTTTLKIIFALAANALALDVIFSQPALACGYERVASRSSVTGKTIYSYERRCQNLGERLYENVTGCPTRVSDVRLRFQACFREQLRVGQVNSYRRQADFFGTLRNPTTPDYFDAAVQDHYASNQPTHPDHWLGSSSNRVGGSGGSAPQLRSEQMPVFSTPPRVVPNKQIIVLSSSITQRNAQVAAIVSRARYRR
jgi:hypothetical protein